MFIHKHVGTLGIITIGQWTIPYRIIAYMYMYMYVHVYDYKRKRNSHTQCISFFSEPNMPDKEQFIVLPTFLGFISR